MNGSSALESIENEVAEILGRFNHDRDGIWIAAGDQAEFIGLVLEATDIMSDLGLTAFSMQLRGTASQGRLNYLGSQSYASVEESLGIIRSAIRRLARGTSSPVDRQESADQPYVSAERLQQLRGLPPESYDFHRLVRLCEEVNSSFAIGNYIATASLLRAIKDHVPPALGARNFSEFASQCPSSLKGSMQHLEQSMKHVADQWLHGQIRRKESLPTAQQVDFRQDLDVLLGEVVRVSR